MSDQYVNQNLNLYIGKQSDYKFYLYEIILQEGLCLIPHADLTLYSRELYKLDQLQELLECAACVSISLNENQDGNQAQVTRWYSGMITEVNHLGIVQEASGSDDVTYRYSMSIEAPLAHLCHSHRRHEFADATPEEAISKLLKDEYNILYEIPEDIAQKLKTKNTFSQGEESDYEFLLKIFALYGLSFYFVTAEYNASSGAALPLMKISNGSTYEPMSPFQPKLPDSLKFQYRNSASSGYRLNDWTMGSKIGTDRVEVNYTDTEKRSAQYAIGPDRSIRKNIYRSNPFGLNQDDQIKVATDNYMRALNLDKVNWSGQTNCLEAIPGAAIDIAGFYGKKNRDTIEAYIISATLTFRAPLPSTMVSTTEHSTVSTSVNFCCLSRESGNECTVSLHPKQPQQQTPAPTPPTPPTPPQPEPVKVGCQIFTAIVCDKNGKTTSRNGAIQLTADSGGEYHFNALVNNQTVNVYFVMPLAGFGQGLFRVPRIDDRIVVLKAQTDLYYMLGYLTDSTMYLAKKLDDVTNYANLNESLVMRYNKPGESGSYADQIPASSPQVYESDTINFSELGFYNSYKDNKNKTKENLTNLQSHGEMQIAAKKNLEINANNIHLNCRDAYGWKDVDGKLKKQDNVANLVVDHVNQVTITADTKILLKVGYNFISISKNGIIIRSCKWSDTGGPFDASVLLDSISGVTITGMKCGMTGVFGATMKDALGGAMGVSCGNSSSTGTVIKHETIDGIDLLMNGIDFGVNLGAELFAMGFKKSATAQNVTWTIQSSADMIIHFIQSWKNFPTGENNDGWDKLSAVLLMIVDIINNIVNIITAWNPSWLEQPACGKNKEVTNRDAIRLSALCTSAAAYIIVIVKSVAKAKWKEVSTVKMVTSELSVTGTELNVLGVTATVDNNALSGFKIGSKKEDKLEEKLDNKQDNILEEENKIDNNSVVSGNNNENIILKSKENNILNEKE